jgi:hypothetical protein
MAGLVLGPGVVAGQSAGEIMRRALDAQVERLAGVENVTITQEVMGMETTMYMEKREADGIPFLFPVSVTMAGMTNAIPEEMAQSDWSNPFQDEWVERARLVGEESVDGHQAYVLAIEDFSGLEMPSVPGASEGFGDLHPTSVRFWLGKDNYVTRKVVMDMEGTGPDGAPSQVHMEMFLEDYREVDGYLHPFVTRTVTQGMMEAMDMDPEEVRAQLAQLRAQLDNVPDAQRAMLEGMLGSQIERLEGMLEGGTMEVTITVREIKVNQGSGAST